MGNNPEAGDDWLGTRRSEVQILSPRPSTTCGSRLFSSLNSPMNSSCRYCAKLWLLCALLITTASAQVDQTQSDEIKNSVKRIQSGKFDVVDINRVARAGAVQAIPSLKGQFVHGEDAYIKTAVASALLRLGDKQQIYWDYLADQARRAIESDAPFPFRFDAQGHMIPRQLAPEFVAWAKARHVSPEHASAAQLYEAPSAVLVLAITADPRGEPLLRSALLSRNYFIENQGARGLAILQDKESIPAIIEACDKAPLGMAALIARSLAVFDDSRARSALEKFIPDRNQLELLRKGVREHGTDILF